MDISHIKILKVVFVDNIAKEKPPWLPGGLLGFIGNEK